MVTPQLSSGPLGRISVDQFKDMLKLQFVIFQFCAFSLCSQTTIPLGITQVSFPFDKTVTLNVDTVFHSISLHVEIDSKRAELVVFRPSNRLSSVTFDTLNVIPIGEAIDSVRMFVDQRSVGQDVVVCQDLNFDSYPDLMILDAITYEKQNPSYTIWLYDPHLLRYRYSDDFSSKLSSIIQVDTINQTVCNSYVNEFFIEDGVRTTYIPSRDTLVLTSKESVDHFMSGDSIHYTWKAERLIKGSMVVVSQKVFNTAEEMGLFFKHH